MKTIKYTIAIIFIALLTACSQPQVTAHDINGKTIDFSQYKGKWIVVNYWATWCKPCVKEMPILNELSNKYSKDVVVIGINYDQISSQEQRIFAKNLKLTYPLLASNPAEELGIKDTSVIPATYLINPQGKLVKTLYGPQSLKSFLAALKINDEKSSATV